MRLQRKKGQSLVEFTLLLSILLIIVMGLLDIGRVYFTYLALQDLAGEGASYGAVYPSRIDSTDEPDPNNVLYRVRSAAPSGMLVDPADLNITVSTPSGTDPGDFITVTVVANYTLLTPFVGSIVGSQNLPLSASTTTIILTGG